MGWQTPDQIEEANNAINNLGTDSTIGEWHCANNLRKVFTDEYGEDVQDLQEMPERP